MTRHLARISLRLSQTPALFRPFATQAINKEISLSHLVGEVKKDGMLRLIDHLDIIGAPVDKRFLDFARTSEASNILNKTLACLNVDETAYEFYARAKQARVKNTGYDKRKFIAYLPEEYYEMGCGLSLYAEILLDLLNNKLSSLAYEPGLTEQINEKTHSLLARQLTIAARLPLGDRIMMLFHDVGRNVNSDIEQSHLMHYKVGHQVTELLNLFPFCLGHSFAKNCLFGLSEYYRDEIISPLSSYTLKIQSDDAAQFKDIYNYIFTGDPVRMTKVLSNLLLFRMIDDLAKDPRIQPEFNWDELLAELHQYINLLCHRKSINHLKSDLQKVAPLLLSAEQYSVNPDLYAAFRRECNILGILDETNSRLSLR